MVHVGLPEHGHLCVEDGWRVLTGSVGGDLGCDLDAVAPAGGLPSTAWAV